MLFNMRRWRANNTDYTLERAAEKLATLRKGKNGTVIPPPWLTAQRKHAGKKHGRRSTARKHIRHGGRRTRRRRV